MSNDRGSFRRRLFGGFDRTDVINYIENIAGQRNKYQTEAQRLSDETNELRSKLDSVTCKIQEKDDKISETSKELDAARKELNDIWKDLREAQDELDVVKGQLDSTKKELAAKNIQYDKDINEAKDALNEAVAQRLDAINSASQIISELRSKYESNVSAMSTAFTDAEAKFQQLVTDKEK